MEEFTIFIRHKPKQLLRVCDMLSRCEVNIEAVFLEVTGEDAVIKIVTNDPIKTKKAFREAGIPFGTKEVLVVKSHNRPGELNKVTKKLGEANLNIESIYFVRDDKIALRVDDMKKAREVLREDLLS